MEKNDFKKSYGLCQEEECYEYVLSSISRNQSEKVLRTFILQDLIKKFSYNNVYLEGTPNAVFDRFFFYVTLIDPVKARYTLYLSVSSFSLKDKKLDSTGHPYNPDGSKKSLIMNFVIDFKVYYY